MEEYWEVFDKYRRKTGKVIKRDSNQWLQEGEYHIVITGIIQNLKNQILITKRKENKKVFPSLWECTSGSVKQGETSLEATIREVEEEIGITLKPTEGKFLGTIRSENYFRDVWNFKKNIKDEEINFIDGEVVDFNWVSIEEYSELYKEGKIVPSGDFVIKFLKEKELEEER